jgi:hypothetical protein
VNRANVYYDALIDWQQMIMKNEQLADNRIYTPFSSNRKYCCERNDDDDKPGQAQDETRLSMPLCRNGVNRK